MKEKHFSSHITIHTVSLAAGSEWRPVTVGAIAGAGCLPLGFNPLSQGPRPRGVYLTYSQTASTSLPPLTHLRIKGNVPHTTAISDILINPRQSTIHHKDPPKLTHCVPSYSYSYLHILTYSPQLPCHQSLSG